VRRRRSDGMRRMSRALLQVAILRHQAQGLFDAQAGTVKQNDESTVADAGPLTNPGEVGVWQLRCLICQPVPRYNAAGELAIGVLIAPKEKPCQPK